MYAFNLMRVKRVKQALGGAQAGTAAGCRGGRTHGGQPLAEPPARQSVGVLLSWAWAGEQEPA